MLHRDNPDVDVSDIVSWMNEFCAFGKVHCIGVSNWTLSRVRAANECAYKTGRLPIGAVSNYCGPLKWTSPPWPLCVQMTSSETRLLCEELQIPMFSWSPLSYVLSLQLNRSDPSFNTPANRAVVQELLSGSTGSAAIAAVFNNLLQISGWVGLVISTTSIEHLRELLTCKLLPRS